MNHDLLDEQLLHPEKPTRKNWIKASALAERTLVPAAVRAAEIILAARRKAS